MDNCHEDKATIAYQGAPGSYSHLCLTSNFPNATALGHTTFEGAIEAVKTGRASCALLPIENSIAGRVMDMHHLLAGSGLKIRAQYYQQIRHTLLARDGATLSSIKTVYSHPMALAQCRNFIHEHNLNTVSYSDTADAAKLVSESTDTSIAAIAAEHNTSVYPGLIALATDIQDIQDNETRFFLVTPASAESADNLPGVKDAQYITAVFYTVKNIPAALYKSLSGFATSGVNVIKLESFMPMHGNGSARFYIEIDGAQQEPAVSQALDELGHYASSVEILGSFPISQ